MYYSNLKKAPSLKLFFKLFFKSFILGLGFCSLVGCGNSNKGAEAPVSGVQNKPGQKPVTPAAKSCGDQFRQQADSKPMPFVDSPLTTVDDIASAINVEVSQGMPFVNYWLQPATTSEPQHLKIEKARQPGNGHIEVLTADLSSTALELTYRHTIAGLPVLTLSQKFEITGAIADGSCALNLKSVEKIDFTAQYKLKKFKAVGKIWNSDQPKTEVDIKNEWNLEDKTSYFDQVAPFSLQTMNLLATPSTRIFTGAESPIFQSSVVKQGTVAMLDPASNVIVKFTKFLWKGHPTEGAGTDFIKSIYISESSKALVIVDNSQARVHLSQLQWQSQSIN